MKIAIVTRKMITGGVERALIGMLRSMNNNDEVDLYVEQLGGELFEEIPSWVNVIEIPQRNDGILENDLFTMIKVLSARIKLHFCKSYVKQCELSVRSFPTILKEYDMAIAYHAPNTIPVFYVIHNIRAKKKVLWLHGDVETNHMTGVLARKYYKHYDRVFAVSKQSKEIFDNHFPMLSQRSEVFYNIIDVDYLKKQTENAPTYTDDFKGTRILTIGRLDHQKGIDIAIKVCRRLIDAGISVRWYVCGDGKERKSLENIISAYKLNECFLLLGNYKNPYGFLRDCDIYVQPSRTEGYCTATREAAVFAKPIVVTDVCGMREQFINEETGIICEISVESIFENLVKVLKNPDLLLKLSNNRIGVDIVKDIDSMYRIIKIV